MLRTKRRELAIPGRRQFIQGLSCAGLPLVTGAAASAFLTSCAEGTYQKDSAVTIKPNATGGFKGGVDFRIDDVPDDISATLTRASLTAPEGVNDLTFLSQVVGAGYDWVTTENVPLARADSFPKNDTIGVLEIVFTDDLRRFISTMRERPTIRVWFTGMIDTTGLNIPAEGIELGLHITLEAT